MPNLATKGFDLAALRYFPNPVKDILNLSYKDEIRHVEIFNLLGQLVLRNDINTTTAQVDLRSLPQGNYFVKLDSGNTSETIKIMKI